MTSSPPCARREMDDLAFGLALRGWMVRLEPTAVAYPPGGAGHVVVGAGCTTARYLVRPAGRRREVGVRRGEAVVPLGVAFDVDEVHSLIRHEIAAHTHRPSTQPQQAPNPVSPPAGSSRGRGRHEPARRHRDRPARTTAGRHREPPARPSHRAGRRPVGDVTTELPALPGWTVDALCAQVDPDLWFPEPGVSSGPAKRVCRQCVVAAECLEYALERRIWFGVWGGGVAEHDRRALAASAWIEDTSEATTTGAVA